MDQLVKTKEKVLIRDGMKLVERSVYLDEQNRKVVKYNNDIHFLERKINNYYEISFGINFMGKVLFGRD